MIKRHWLKNKVTKKKSQFWFGKSHILSFNKYFNYTNVFYVMVKLSDDTTKNNPVDQIERTFPFYFIKWYFNKWSKCYRLIRIFQPAKKIYPLHLCGPPVEHHSICEAIPWLFFLATFYNHEWPVATYLHEWQHKITEP